MDLLVRGPEGVELHTLWNPSILVQATLDASDGISAGGHVVSFVLLLLKQRSLETLFRVENGLLLYSKNRIIIFIFIPLSPLQDAPHQLVEGPPQCSGSTRYRIHHPLHERRAGCMRRGPFWKGWCSSFATVVRGVVRWGLAAHFLTAMKHCIRSCIKRRRLLPEHCPAKQSSAKALCCNGRSRPALP